MVAFALNLTLGPIICGAFFTVFFFGLTCMQTINYLKQFPNDFWMIKYTVMFLWVLQLTYTACICQGAYVLAVTDFGQLLSLLSTPWGLNLGVVIGSLIDHGVQAFFVTRIYKVTGALYVSIFLWIIVALLQVTSFKLAAEAIRTDSIPIVGQTQKWLLNLLFFGDASLDIVNACVLSFYLKVKSRSAFSKNTAIILDRLVVYTLQTGFLTSMVALGAAIAYRIAPEDYIWTFFFMSMPGSFLNALLANVNNRRSLSQVSAAVSTGTTTGFSQGASIQFTRNVVMDPISSVRSEHEPEDPDSNAIEMNKVSTPSDIYTFSAV
ncbi:hypothetical protein R3P38DRAFT_655082 [Favolaschia claudopus]|uniref:DUF6534 domain-containing protein n=1 Tax=Favolaschia claudopus TaxID=2862362 RepID=A0AAW0E7K5_9AGAR